MTNWHKNRVARLRRVPAIKELLDYANEHEVPVKFISRANGAWHRGYMQSHPTQEIGVFLRDMNGKLYSEKDLVFILAHEIRHLQHIVNGEYDLYYSNDQVYLPNLFSGAYKVEKECDSWARKHLKKYEYDYKTGRPAELYEKWKVDPRFLPTNLRVVRIIADGISARKRVRLARKRKQK